MEPLAYPIQIRLTKEQSEALREKAKATGIKKTDLVRMGADLVVAQADDALIDLEAKLRKDALAARHAAREVTSETQ